MTLIQKCKLLNISAIIDMIIIYHIIMFLLDIDGVLKLGKAPIAAGVAALKLLED